VKAADDGPPSWRSGVVCMTARGVSVKLDRAEVLNRPYARPPSEFDTWTCFWEGAPTK
jgi:hypothetical protein